MDAPTLPTVALPPTPIVNPPLSKHILFDHVPKTGGTALHALLQTILGASQCSPIITGSIGQARAAFARFRCVSGHFFYYPGADLADLWTFTVLRNPVERLLSHLTYLRHDMAPAGDAFSQKVRALDLVSYIESDDPQIVDSLSNTMVAHFAPLAWDGAEELTAERKLALAKEALRRFDLVGLTERMAETADLLCHALGQPLASKIRQLNVSSHKSASASLPAATRARLQRLNELDIEFYAYARELHDGCRRRAIFGSDIVASPAGSAHAALPSDVHAVATHKSANFGNREVELLSAEVFAQAGTGASLLAGEMATARVLFRTHRAVDDLTVGLRIHDDRGGLVFATNTRHYGHALQAAAGTECRVDFIFRADIGAGHYVAGASLHPTASHLPTCYHWVDEMSGFDVVGNVGWHFDGTTKLSPNLKFGGMTRVPDPSPDPSTAIQRLALIAPPIRDFRARLTARAPLPEMPAGQLVAALVDVVNLGAETWPSVGERSVRVSYHWLDAASNVAVQDGERTHLPHDVAAGEIATLWATVRAPDIPGDYRLQLTLVQEAVQWLEPREGEMLEMAVRVGS